MHFFDNIKSRSFFADKLRILKQKYYLTSKKIKHDHDYFYGEDGTKNKIINNYEYINYEKALEIHDIEYLKSKLVTIDLVILMLELIVRSFP